MKLIHALLLGLVAADDTTKIWDLQSTKDQRDESMFQVWYGDWSTGKANARPPYRSNYVMA